MKIIRFVVLFVLLCVVASGQSTSTFYEEINFGRYFRNSLLASRAELKESPETEVGRQVFNNLLSTRIAQSGPRFPFRLTFFDSYDINASSTAGGEIFAEGGLVNLLKDSPGLWAAVLGHEIAHTELSHQFKAAMRYLAMQQQAEVLRRRAAAGDQAAQWALIGLNIGGGLLNLKLSRNEELEADRLGLYMMAEAGYHPDFAITCYRRLAFKTGDQSKASAFFSDHPRWETREQKALKAYDNALAVFNAKWPDAAKSPGGLPPAIAIVGKIQVTQDKINKAVVIKAPVTVRNVAEGGVQAGLFFLHNGQYVPSAMEEFSVGSSKTLGRMISWSPKSLNDSSECEFVIPSAAVGGRDRKLRGALVIFGPDKEMIHTAIEFNVNFPSVK